MQTVEARTDDRGVLTLTLNHPELHNAFDDRLIGTLTECLEEAERDPALRVLVLTGAGPSFSAGADLNWMRRMADASEAENERDARALARLMRCLNYFPRPTIARVNGHAFGGAVGLIACCDVAIGSEEARLGLTEVRMGLAPAVISPYVMRRIGEANARRYMLSGERFDARCAEAMGLLHERVPAAALNEAVERMVSKLLRGGPEAVAACKLLISEVGGHDRAQQRLLDEKTARLIARLRVSTEGQEGLQAFLQKRAPTWLDEPSPGT